MTRVVTVDMGIKLWACRGVSSHRVKYRASNRGKYSTGIKRCARHGSQADKYKNRAIQPAQKNRRASIATLIARLSEKRSRRLARRRQHFSSACGVFKMLWLARNRVVAGVT